MVCKVFRNVHYFNPKLLNILIYSTLSEGFRSCAGFTGPVSGTRYIPSKVETQHGGYFMQISPNIDMTPGMYDAVNKLRDKHLSAS